MSVVKTSRSLELVPGYVTALCDQAARAGLTIAPPRIETFAVWKNRTPEARVVANWIGPGSAFYATGIFTPGQRRILEWPGAQQLLTVPGGMNYYQVMDKTNLPLLFGYASGAPEGLDWSLDLGEPPISIVRRGAVETICTESHISRHGTIEALTADGIPSNRFPMGVRAIKSAASQSNDYSGDDGPTYSALRWWACRRLPDGSFLYREDSESTFAARVAELQELTERMRRLRPGWKPKPQTPGSPHLRLVVDNS